MEAASPAGQELLHSAGAGGGRQSPLPSASSPPRALASGSGLQKETSGKAGDGAAEARVAEAAGALEEELYAVYPAYVDLDKIEAAVKGEEEGLRAQLEAIRADKEEARQEWIDLRQRGTLWLVVAYLTQQWLDALRRDHMWGSIFFTPQEDLLVVTRPQRLLILVATCLTSMAINAVFFGSEAERISAHFVSAAISAASMIPVERLSPRLFAFINTFRAESLDVTYAVR